MLTALQNIGRFGIDHFRLYRSELERVTDQSDTLYKQNHMKSVTEYITVMRVIQSPSASVRSVTP